MKEKKIITVTHAYYDMNHGKGKTLPLETLYFREKSIITRSTRQKLSRRETISSIMREVGNCKEEEYH